MPPCCQFSFVVDIASLFHAFRIRNCLTQLYAKDITPYDKQELDEALQREVSRCQLAMHSFVLNSNLAYISGTTEQVKRQL